MRRIPLISRALCFPRERAWHRRPVYEAGLQRLGVRTVREIPHPQPGDLLVLWNRMRTEEEMARRFEKAGATVIITENGWIGPAEDGGKFYGLCLSHHNGAGSWPIGGPERWASFGIDLKPWRTDAEHVLVICQRGFGPPGVAMPREWPAAIERRLEKITRRPIRVRLHRGLKNGPIEPDFKNCWAVVTWGSGGAIKALAAGIPVIAEMPHWLGAGMASPSLDEIEAPFLGDRLPAFQRLAWAQWTVEEIQSGEPFARLLSR